MVYGRNSVVEALRADVPVATMYIATRIDTDDRVREALKLATERGLAILETPRGELDRLTDGGVHQGLALQVPPYEYAHPSDLIDPEMPGIPLVVALDGITDPRNLGAIVRSVAAFGGHGVVVPERRSVGMTASAWKTSAGAAARMPVAKASNLTRALEEFKKAGFFIVGLDMDGDVELPDLTLASEPLVIVTGSEGKGLSRLVRETCDQIVSIPMSSAVESLNAGLATGVDPLRDRPPATPLTYAVRPALVSARGVRSCSWPTSVVESMSRHPRAGLRHGRGLAQRTDLQPGHARCPAAHGATGGPG